MEDPRLAWLFQRQIAQMATAAEKEELLQLMSKPENELQVQELLEEAWEKFEPARAPFMQEKSEAILQKILDADSKSRAGGAVYEMETVRNRFNWVKIAAAAAIILLFSTIAYFIFQQKPEKEIVRKENIPSPVVNDILPGGNKAVLTLVDGSTIVLDNSANGELAQQGNTKIVKLDNGQLAYNASGSATTETLFNTVTTPKGGQYKIVLADGTAVWLNAASSIKYPASFTGKERRVEITGEAYFEVKPVPSNSPKRGEKEGQGKMPFIVKVNTNSGEGGEVEVLGTHFNVNAYNDEAAINTTLLEGKVKVSASESQILLPGQQAQLNKNGNIKLVKNADTEEAIAWKNGKFQFNKASLESVMRQLVRWYDVVVEYKGKIPEQRFGGEVSRNNNLSQVLQILEMSGVKFRIEGKKIIVGE